MLVTTTTSIKIDDALKLQKLLALPLEIEQVLLVVNAEIEEDYSIDIIEVFPLQIYSTLPNSKTLTIWESHILQDDIILEFLREQEKDLENIFKEVAMEKYALS